MALTTFGTNNAIAVKLFSRRLFMEALKGTWFEKFVGEDDNNIIVMLNDTKKSKGDKITVPLQMQLVGAGTQGDGTLAGNEEALGVFSDALTIDQIRHAVRSGGKMSEQRIPFEVRRAAYNGLRDWLAGRYDFWFMNQLAGNTAQTDTRYTGNQATIAPDTNHRIWAGAVSDDASLGAANIFNLNLIDKAVERAKTLDVGTATGLVPIRPLRIKGENKYVAFLHPYQVYDLRTQTATGQWLDIQKAAAMGGEVTKNPIYSGALGEYNGVILHESYRMPLGVANAGGTVASTRRAVFCGAQAAVIAFGQEDGPNQARWVEELFDYQNQLGVSAGVIAGLKKLQFQSVDFGTITLSSYAAQHN